MNDTQRVVASFVYRDECGAPFTRIDRIEPGRDGAQKEFLPYLADGRGGFRKLSGLNGMQIPLYRLDELRASIRADTVVWLVEGEGKCDLLLSALREAGRSDAVTTIAGGANARLTDTHLAQLDGALAVVVLADSDTVGRGAAQKRGQAIADKYPTCDVRIIDLFPDRTDGSDVADFLNGGGTLDEILARVRTAAEVIPSLMEAASLTSSPPETGALPGWVKVGALLAEPDEQHGYLVEELLLDGGTSLLVAKPKVGKSTLALNLAFCVARGEPFLGRVTKKGIVLYVALEGNRTQLKSQCRTMGMTPDDDISFYISRAPTDAFSWLEIEARKRKPDLIIVDTFQRFARLRDQNDYALVTNALDPLTHLARETGTHLLLTHHAKKSGGIDGDAVLGSTALFAAVDTLLEMRRRNGVRSLSTIQRYGEDLEPTVIALDADTNRISAAGTAAEADGKRMAAEMLASLESINAPVRQEELFDAIEGRRTTKLATLRALIEHGVVLRTGAGKKGDPHLYAPAPKPVRRKPADSRIPVPAIHGEPENGNRESGEIPCSREIFPGSQDSADAQAGGQNPEPVVKLTPGARAIRDEILADFRDVFDENGRVRP